MSLESLYFNLSTQRWVLSYDEPANATFPTFGQGDARDFGVTFLKSIGASTVQVVQNVVGVQIGLSDPSTPAVILTSATAGPAVNNEFPFILNITGSGITTIMTSQTKPVLVACEFRIATSLGVNRVGTSVYVKPQQLTDVTADPAAADRSLGFLEAGGIFLTKEVPQGTRMIWTDEVTNQVYSVGFLNGKLEANLL